MWGGINYYWLNLHIVSGCGEHIQLGVAEMKCLGIFDVQVGSREIKLSTMKHEVHMEGYISKCRQNGKMFRIEV
jgi:hypothetical protein